MTGFALIAFLLVWTGLAAAMAYSIWNYLMRSYELGRIGNYLHRWIERDETPTRFEFVACIYGVILALFVILTIVGLSVTIWQLSKLV